MYAIINYLLLSDVLMAVDEGNIAALALLDLLSAFDSVDHDSCFNDYRVQTSYGFDGVALSWFASYLKGRVQNVRLSMTSSSPSFLVFHCAARVSLFYGFMTRSARSSCGSATWSPTLCSYPDMLR